ncbi:LOW QUALITY PROTEIN: ankyrin repeat domain-containing protein 66 [Sphaerodactylus townsendi]|uniref:LOW QUALITY PROTEIN: ankyrin repeat domain-containing protein 66 n=1 Tax=Sphaerodactylus townsendi TaxID=933632 RepID=UPI002025FD8E|nr:LOW QUALITY PROTEIN: ankyrin repeat domain-containing protein 66 [Sphaerodactylus townsendi]
MSELHQAAASGNCDLVDEILRKGQCDPNGQDPDWNDRTPLHWAAIKGCSHSRQGRNEAALGKAWQASKNVTDSETTCEHGAWLCLRTYAGWTPPFAAELGRLGVLRTLHSLHAPVDATDLYGDTPKRMAEIYGHKDCVKFLERAEAECRGYRQAAKLKGVQLDEIDEEWELKKDELLKSEPPRQKKTTKKCAKKGGY